MAHHAAGAASPAAQLPPEAGSGVTEGHTVDREVIEQLRAYLPPGSQLPDALDDLPLPDIPQRDLPHTELPNHKLKEAVVQARERRAALDGAVEREKELAAQLVRTRDGIVTQHGVKTWTKTAARDSQDWEYAHNVWRDVSAVDREYRMAFGDLNALSELGPVDPSDYLRAQLAMSSASAAATTPTWLPGGAGQLAMPSAPAAATAPEARGSPAGEGRAAGPGGWGAAAAANASELRPDPTCPDSPTVYNKSQFVEFYGAELGEQMWSEAEPAAPRAPRAPAPLNPMAEPWAPPGASAAADAPAQPPAGR
eukprot:TRINITY_DN17972_c0_g2_i1.p1 TRINITY_DN17972_c0_g2~~TRINITY_DN17972_c0_g2_i1.p1  ORF type:complete len:332 (+),score=84.85 TRINITY_DN17972_c0_g2_i1:67-996(+)